MFNLPHQNCINFLPNSAEMKPLKLLLQKHNTGHTHTIIKTSNLTCKTAPYITQCDNVELQYLVH